MLNNKSYKLNIINAYKTTIFNSCFVCFYSYLCALNHLIFEKMKKMTPKEEEILNRFWTHGPLFIRELLELHEEPRPHYNTLSTIVRVLEEKGYIGYKAYGNTYRYFATISREAYRKKKLQYIVDNYFGNSYTRVVSALIDENELSIEELQALIEDIKSRKGT